MSEIEIDDRSGWMDGWSTWSNSIHQIDQEFGVLERGILEASHLSLFTRRCHLMIAIINKEKKALITCLFYRDIDMQICTNTVFHTFLFAHRTRSFSVISFPFFPLNIADG